MQKKLLLILSIFTLFNTGCIKLKPKTVNKDSSQQNNRTQTYTVDELKLNQFLSNKSEANFVALANEFQYNDEITLNFNRYMIELDSFDLMSEITNTYEIYSTNGDSVKLFDFKRSYNGKQFSSIVDVDRKALEYILDGIDIEFSNASMKYAVTCSLNQLNARIENQFIVFSIANNQDCEIDQLISKKDSKLKIKIINNVKIDSKIKTINNGQSFSETKRFNPAGSQTLISQELLYSDLVVSEINPEFKVQFKLTISTEN